MENEQAKKNFLIKVGVITSALLILIFWLLNMKNVFVFNETETTNNQSLAELTEEFRSIVDKINVDVIKDVAIEPQEDKNNLTESIIEATKNGLSKEKEVSDALEDEIVNSESDQINTPIFDEAPQMAPVLYIDGGQISIPTIPSNNSSGCPAYVNCMPTIGEARQCSIPPGCEGITQFVY